MDVLFSLYPLDLFIFFFVFPYECQNQYGGDGAKGGGAVCSSPAHSMHAPNVTRLITDVLHR